MLLSSYQRSLESSFHNILLVEIYLNLTNLGFLTLISLGGAYAAKNPARRIINNTQDFSKYTKIVERSSDFFDDVIMLQGDY